MIAPSVEDRRLVSSIVALHAGGRGAAPAYTFLRGGRAEASLTFAEVERQSRAVAGALAARSDPGARVAIVVAPSLEGVIALIGTLRAGRIAVPIPPPAGHSAVARLNAVARDCDAALVLTSEATRLGTEGAALLPPVPLFTVEAALAEGAAAELPALAADDVAVLQYTSGATADPKGVIVTHGNLAAAEVAIAAGFGTRESDTVLSWQPMEHDMGLVGGILHGLWNGIQTYLMSPTAFVRKPRAWLEAIGRYGITLSGGPNFAYELCVDAIPPAQRAGLSLATWRVAYNGAETVRAETLSRFTAAFAPAGFDPAAHYPCYGLAEATLLATGGERDATPRTRAADPLALGEGRLAPSGSGRPARTLVSCGTARTTGGIRIVDPNTRAPLPEGVAGEIWLAGDTIARGYWRRPEESEATFAARTADGAGPYLRTGDLGLLSEGELFVTGRLKDLLIVRGRNIHPADVERSLAAVPCCRSHRAVAYGGEDGVVLAQELREGAADPAMVARTIWRAVLRDHGVAPAEVLMVRPGTLLWTTSGKLRRRATMERIAREPERVLHRATGPEPAEAIQREATLALPERMGSARPADLDRFLTAWIAAAVDLEPDAIDPDIPFADLGLTSISAVELSGDLEAATGLTLGDSLVFDHPTLRTLAGALAGRLA